MATVAGVDLGALSIAAAARAAPPACVRARSCLAACVARRRGGTTSLLFAIKAFPGRRTRSFSRTDAGDLAALLLFAVLAPFPSHSSALAAPPRTEPPIGPPSTSSTSPEPSTEPSSPFPAEIAAVGASPRPELLQAFPSPLLAPLKSW